MQTALIVNASSRNGRKLYAEIEKRLKAEAQPLVLSEDVARPDRIPAAIARAKAAGAERIVLGGGDGTISSSAKQMGDLGLVMAILPLGTANSFARTIGLPLEMEGALAVALGGRIETIDLGRLGDHCFTNAAAIGLPAQVGRTIPDGLKRVFGRFAYALWGLWKLLGFRGFTCILDDGTGPQRHDVVEVRLMNGRFLGGMKTTDKPDLEDHEIVVQLVNGTHNWQLAKAWAHIATGMPPEIGEISELRAAGWSIETLPSQPVSIDGEVLANTPTRVGVAVDALRLMVPDEFDG